MNTMFILAVVAVFVLPLAWFLLFGARHGSRSAPRNLITLQMAALTLLIVGYTCHYVMQYFALIGQMLDSAF